MMVFDIWKASSSIITLLQCNKWHTFLALKDFPICWQILNKNKNDSTENRMSGLSKRCLYLPSVIKQMCLSCSQTFLCSSPRNWEQHWNASQKDHVDLQNNPFFLGNSPDHPAGRHIFQLDKEACAELGQYFLYSHYKKHNSFTSGL